MQNHALTLMRRKLDILTQIYNCNQCVTKQCYSTCFWPVPVRITLLRHKNGLLKNMLFLSGMV